MRLLSGTIMICTSILALIMIRDDYDNVIAITVMALLILGVIFIWGDTKKIFKEIYDKTCEGWTRDYHLNEENEENK